MGAILLKEAVGAPGCAGVAELWPTGRLTVFVDFEHDPSIRPAGGRTLDGT
jgi:hypothetical protein